MIAAQFFVGPRSVTLVGFDDGTVNVECQVGLRTHCTSQLCHHAPQACFTVTATVSSEPVTNGITAGIAVALSHQLIGHIILKCAHIFQVQSTIDEHLG